MIFLFNKNNKATDDQRLLIDTYGEYAPSIRTCETWFRQVKCSDFNVKDKKSQELLDDDHTQAQLQIAEALHVSQEATSVVLRIMNSLRNG